MKEAFKPVCGIVGCWHLDGAPVSPSIFDHFTDSLAHRGPDGRGVYVDTEANLGFGSRRLAILDVSPNGRQPMSYAGGRYWITYNGEIYNFIEVKAELVTLGCTFISESDTEVILAAYEMWGEDCQLHFNGMWAFAIWDRKERELFISRDRFGVKPLIYYYDMNKFAFASEMKAFLELDWFNRRFDPTVVAAAILDNDLIEGSEACLLEGLKKLLGGFCLRINGHGELQIRRWWNTLDHLEEVPQSYEKQTEKYRDLFLDACRIRMRSDVPIGTALSGGLDSSSIVCGMNHIKGTLQSGERLARDWQKAFIVTYPGSNIDEKQYADEVITRTSVKPVYCTVTPDMYLQFFDQILFQFEEISDIFLGPWLVHKAQRENGVVVTLDGHGGDESLGGYPWHVTSMLKDHLLQIRPRKFLESYNTLKKMELFPEGHFLYQSVHSFIIKYKNAMLKRNGAQWLVSKPKEFYSPALQADGKRLKSQDSLFKRLYMDFHFTQLPMNLRDFDRLSMAHGVEVRSPFMDWRLVCLSFSLPSNSKIEGGYTKKILRDSLKDILPTSIRNRTRKLGFPNMIESWSSKRGHEFIRDLVASSEFQSSPIWDGPRIRKDLDEAEHQKNQEVFFNAWIYVQAMSLMKMFRQRRGGTT